MSQDDTSPPAVSAPGGTGVPVNSEELDRLLEERPPGWEYLLFGAVLWQGKEELALAWRDHELRLPTGPYRRLEEDEVAGFLSEALGRLTWIIEPMSRVFEAQEDAFGKPGDPGNVQLIEHFARWIVSVYRQLLQWAGEVRSAVPPDELRKAIELAAHAADAPIQQIREFVDRTAAQLEQIPEYLRRPESERKDQTLQLELTLTLSADEALLDEALSELQAALGGH
jgi:hypothetical protein